MSRRLRRSLCRLLAVGCIAVTLPVGAVAAPASAAAADDVTLSVSGLTATMSTGAYTIKFNSKGAANSLVAGGRELIGKAAGFYTDIEGGKTGLAPTKLTVITNTPQMADIAYTSSLGELHYVMRSGVNGLYSYFVTTGIGTVGEFRSVQRLDGSIFRTAVNTLRSGAMP